MTSLRPDLAAAPFFMYLPFSSCLGLTLSALTAGPHGQIPGPRLENGMADLVAQSCGFPFFGVVFPILSFVSFAD